MHPFEDAATLASLQITRSPKGRHCVCSPVACPGRRLPLTIRWTICQYAILGDKKKTTPSFSSHRPTTCRTPRMNENEATMVAPPAGDSIADTELVALPSGHQITRKPRRLKS